MFKFGSIFLDVHEIFAKNGVSNNNQKLHVRLKEVIIINKLMKLDKMFTVKRKLVIYKMQIRFIRSEKRNL